ncbi:protein of unknown function [Nitrospira defluvii]|uniref:Uncharacterized protein n=1 Tax=Nitrospira defluvii TaxID=330214 RepID=D8PGW6_9BACT|nr:protein of unknown function [Nitrospira defluvii]
MIQRVTFRLRLSPGSDMAWTAVGTVPSLLLPSWRLGARHGCALSPCRAFSFSVHPCETSALCSTMPQIETIGSFLQFNP